MPYDKYTDNGEYTDVLNVISQLLYTHNPNHVIIGGDMNVDFSRHTYYTRILLMILIYIHVLVTDLPCDMVPHTYISHSNTTSKLDHCFVTELLKDNMITCSSIDNHLYSDHVSIYLELNIDVIHELEEM